MKKIVYIIILIMLFSLVGCKKKTTEFVYVENTDFVINSNTSLTNFTAINKIDIEISNSIKGIDYVNKCLIVENLNTNKYGVIGTDNSVIVPFEYTIINKEYGKYVLIKDDSVSVFDYGKGIIKSFEKGDAKVLYDNVIAYFPYDSYKIIITDLKTDKSYEIYDNKKSKDNIYNYGKYLIYKNVEFSEFQAYRYDGLGVYNLAATNLFTNLTYIGMDNFFIYEQTMIDNNLVEINSLYNLNTKQKTQLNLSAQEIIYHIKNEGNSENINTKNGFSAFIIRNGNNYYADGNLLNKKGFYGTELNLIDNTAFYIKEETGNLDTKTIIQNNLGETVKEFKASMLLNSVSFNDGILTYGTLVDNSLKYKAVTIENQPILTEDNYDYLSIFVNGVTIGKIGETYYRINKEGTKSILDEQNITVLRGIYYFKSSTKIIVKNYDGTTLIEGDYNSIISTSLNYNSNSSITLSTHNGISFFFLS